MLGRSAGRKPGIHVQSSEKLRQGVDRQTDRQTADRQTDSRQTDRKDNAKRSKRLLRFLPLFREIDESLDKRQSLKRGGWGGGVR